MEKDSDYGKLGEELLQLFKSAVVRAGTSKDRQPFDDMQYWRGVIAARLGGETPPPFNPGDKVEVTSHSENLGDVVTSLRIGEIYTVHKVWYEEDRSWSLKLMEDDRPWIRFPADDFKPSHALEVADKQHSPF